MYILKRKVCIQVVIGMVAAFERLSVIRVWNANPKAVPTPSELFGLYATLTFQRGAYSAPCSPGMWRQ